MERCGVCQQWIEVVNESRQVTITNSESVPEELRAPPWPLPICDDCWERSMQILKVKKRNTN